jgi:hypothetical protein
MACRLILHNDSTEALVLPFPCGCVLRENFASVLLKIPIFSGRSRAIPAKRLVQRLAWIRRRDGALGVADDFTSTEGVDVSM